jgi:hypothetical protein
MTLCLITLSSLAGYPIARYICATLRNAGVSL